MSTTQKRCANPRCEKLLRPNVRYGPESEPWETNFCSECRKYMKRAKRTESKKTFSNFQKIQELADQIYAEKKKRLI